MVGDEPTLQGELVHRRFKPLYANTAFAYLCGCDAPAEILARSDALAFFDAETRAAPEAAWEKLISGPPLFGRREFRRRGGEPFTAEIYARRVNWEAEPAIAMAIIDVSEQERARAALTRERARVKAAAAARRTLLSRGRSEARAAFSAVVSDLRALAGIRPDPLSSALTQQMLGALEELSHRIDRTLQNAERPLPLDLDVLVVEDDPAAAAVLRVALESLGCGVTVAASGAQALAAAAWRGFDVVLMDLIMPDMDGFETARRLSALETPWAPAPIAALSARQGPELSEAVAGAGMDAFLRKPIEITRLAEVLTLLTSRERRKPSERGFSPRRPH